MDSGFSLPTDNLYKFLAIAGLGLYVYSITFPLHGNMEPLLTAFDQRAELKSKLAREKFALSELDRTFKNGHSSKDSKEYRLAALEIELDSARDEMLASRIQILDKQRSWANQCSYIAMEFGAIAAFLGFAFWYTKQQVYEDAIIRAEAHRRAAKYLEFRIPPIVVYTAIFSVAILLVIVLAFNFGPLKSF